MLLSFVHLTLLQGALSLLIYPINQECLQTNYTLGELSTELLNCGSRKVAIRLPPFSYSQIWFDFRHIDLEDKSASISVIVNQQKMIIEDMGKASLYSLFVTQQSSLDFNVQLNDEYAANEHLFNSTVSVETTISDKKHPQVQNEYWWIISSKLSLVNEPMNAPKTESDGSILFQKIMETPQSTKKPLYKSEVMREFQVPYIPYFSRCQHSGSKIFLTKFMQSEEWCRIVPLDKIEPINQLHFGKSPNSDQCSIELQCQYEEEPTATRTGPYWQTLPAKSVLMSVTKYRTQQYNDGAETVDCIIEESQGDNQTNFYPRTVELSLNYYQVTKDESHLISCTVKYGLYLPATTNFGYKLTIKKVPLSHTYILIAFGFNNRVYLIAFILIGLISNIENIALAIYHYIVNRKNRKPFKIKVYLRIMLGMFEGAVAAILPLFILIIIANIIMVGSFFDLPISHFQTNSKQPYVLWDLLGDKFNDYSDQEVVAKRAGRQGLSLCVIGIVVMYYITPYIVGTEKECKKEISMCGTTLQSLTWARGKFWFVAFFYVLIQLFLIYFAYTKLFSQNIWAFIVSTKILQMLLEQLTDIFFKDVMQCIPMKLITEITSYLNTLAANDFYDFMFSFLIDVGLNMVEKAYIALLQNIISDWLQEKSALLVTYFQNIINDEEEQKKNIRDEDVSQDESEDKEVFIAYGVADIEFQQEKEDYNEDIQIAEDDMEAIYKGKLSLACEAKLRGEVKSVILQHDIIKAKEEKKQEANLTLEFTADLFNMPLSLILQPFAILTLWITYSQSQILNNFQIPFQFTAIYLLSAVVIGLFTVINMIVLFFLIENYHGLPVEEYIKNVIERYNSREEYWKVDDGMKSEEVQAKLHRIDNYCLSSQFYFVTTLFVGAMFLVVVGIATMIGKDYNPITDVYFVVILLFWVILTILYVNAMKLFGRLLNMWNYRKYFSPTVHCTDNHETTNQFLNAQEIKKFKQKFVDADDITQSVDEIASVKVRPKLNISLNLKNLVENAERVKEIDAELRTICKKLEPLFDNDFFKNDYARKNKEFIKDNFEYLIGDARNLPQLHLDILNYENEVGIDEQQTNKKIVISKQLHNVLSCWLQETRRNRAMRKQRGIEIEKGLKKCQFCYNNWGIYYGFGGMCLECNERLLKKKHQ